MIKLGVEFDFSFVRKSTAGYMKASVMEQRSDEPYPHKVFYIITSHSSEAGTAAAAAAVDHPYLSQACLTFRRISISIATGVVRCALMLQRPMECTK